VYQHPAFKIDAAEAIALLRERSFGILTVPTDGAPFAVHVPFLIGTGDDGSLHVDIHVARANPIHTYIGGGCKALLICQGPDAYISPDWYGIENQVPTWTYTAVHVQGTARLLPDDGKLEHVDRLSALFEQQLLPKVPWTSGKMDRARRSAMLNAIVGIKIDVESVEGQKKLAQQKGNSERRGAIAGLRKRGRHQDLEIAALMELTLPEASTPER
jgi:transcriptional regulator